MSQPVRCPLGARATSSVRRRLPSLSDSPSVPSLSPSVPSLSPSVPSASIHLDDVSELPFGLDVVVRDAQRGRPYPGTTRVYACGTGRCADSLFSAMVRTSGPAATRSERLEPQEPLHRLGRCRPHRQGRGRGAGWRAARRARGVPRRRPHLAAAAGDPDGRAVVAPPTAVDPGPPVVAAERAPLRRAAGQGQGADLPVGEEQFMLWRRSYDTPPPPLPETTSSAGRRHALCRLPPEVGPAPSAWPTSSPGCSPTGTTRSSGSLTRATGAGRRPRQQPAGADQAPRRLERRGGRRAERADRDPAALRPRRGLLTVGDSVGRTLDVGTPRARDRGSQEPGAALTARARGHGGTAAYVVSGHGQQEGVRRSTSARAPLLAPAPARSSEAHRPSGRRDQDDAGTLLVDQGQNPATKRSSWSTARSPSTQRGARSPPGAGVRSSGEVSLLDHGAHGARRVRDDARPSSSPSATSSPVLDEVPRSPQSRPRRPHPRLDALDDDQRIQRTGGSRGAFPAR